MMNQPASDASANLLSQLNPFFPKPGPGMPAPSAPWEGSLAPAGPPGAFPGSTALPSAMNDAALTGAASGLQAAAQSLLRQRMEALRQQGAGLRGYAGPLPLGHSEVKLHR